jgi:hypothetical protein
MLNQAQQANNLGFCAQLRNGKQTNSSKRTHMSTFGGLHRTY